MPLFKNHSGIIVDIVEEQQIYEALLRGLKMVSENAGLSKHQEREIMLRVDEKIELPSANKKIEMGTLQR